MSPQTFEFHSGGPLKVLGIVVYEECQCRGLRFWYHEHFERHRGRVIYTWLADEDEPSP